MGISSAQNGDHTAAGVDIEMPRKHNDGDFTVSAMEEGTSRKRKLRILSIDGGGMRGIIPARMLAYLEEALKKKSGNPEARIADYFDLVAGTSVGGLIAIMLFATRNKESGKPLFTGEQVSKFIAENGKEIFKIPYPQRIWAKLRGILTPRYSTKFFERILKQHLVDSEGRELTMHDTLRPVAVPCYDLNNAGAFCFYSLAPTNYKLWEVCRATSAVPSFFKPMNVRSVDGNHEFTAIDGGLVVNNPTAAAITVALHDQDKFPDIAGVQDIIVLSLGTGQFDRTYRYKHVQKWGAFQWAKPVVKIIMDGISDMVDHTVSMAFKGYPENYVRIQMSGLPNKALMAMDDPSHANVKRLAKISEELLEDKCMEHIAFGGRKKLDVSNREKLDWFAEQLII